MADWKMWTLQWEYAHLIRFGLQLVALASLLRSVRLETSGDYASIEAKSPMNLPTLPHSAISSCRDGPDKPSLEVAGASTF